MKANYELCLSCSRFILVPYRPEHLPTYHKWMQDPILLESTASEPLSMEDEIRMQQEWRDDERKCTFIILARDLLLLNNNIIEDGNCNYDDDSDIPPPPLQQQQQQQQQQISGSSDEVETIADIDSAGDDDEKERRQRKSYPNLIERTLNAMIGDINLFLSEEEEEIDDENDETDEQSSSTTTPILSQAELDIMIAEQSHQHQNYGTELTLSIMHYGTLHLGINRYFVKIHESNMSSIKLFRDKLTFVQCGYVKCFGEYEFECKCETVHDMLQWIEKTRISRRLLILDDEDNNNNNRCSSNDSGIEKGEKEEMMNGSRLYDIHDCPLPS